MKKSAVLFLLCVLCGWERPAACVHPVRGRSARISLDRVERAHRDVRKRISDAFGSLDPLSLKDGYDSGLPACGRRTTRRIRMNVPRALVGRSISFGPAHRLPTADVRIATSSRSLVELDADGLAHPTLVRRLGVRCSPTRVRFPSETECELLESP